MKGLVLSLFPGIGLLDMAFEEAGFCVVRGPDLLWGGDISSFHPPHGRFDGVIGGPPCKRFSPLANIVRARYGEGSVAPNLIPEFERCVAAAAPSWFVMENVRRAPEPDIAGYTSVSELINNRWCGGEQNRVRRFTFGVPTAAADILDRFRIPRLPEPATFKPAVTTNSGGRRKAVAYDANGRIRGKQGSADEHRLNFRPLAEMAEDQGVPAEFIAALQEHGAFTSKALRIGIGNGVPLTMGRAVAAAVLSALSGSEERAAA